MSHEAFYDYQLEAKRRRQINEARVATTTTQYLNTFRNMMAEFQDQGFDNYIPEMMDRLRRDLQVAETELMVDAFQARETSMEIQAYIYNMRTMARTARIQQEEAEREQRRLEEEARKAQKTEAMNAYYAAIKQVKDAAIQNAARKDFGILRDKIIAGTVTGREQVETIMATILTQAEATAEVFKQKAAEEAKREGIEAQIAEAKKRVKASDMDAAESKKIIKSLDEVLGRAKTAPLQEIQETLNMIDNQALQQMVSEDELREVAKNVCELLRSQGFTIPEGGVKKGDVDGEKRILICGLQSNGHKAMCVLSDKGTIRHSFNGYEGSTCLKDMKAFNEKFQSAYSVKLSNERVLWENPDKISKGEKPMGNTNTKWGTH